jgi:hypothetical protein
MQRPADMDGPKKVWYKLFAIIAFIITVEAYLIVKQHYILASSIIMVCGLGAFMSNKQTAAKLVQQELLYYLGQNNNEVTVVEIIDHMHHASGSLSKTTITDITHHVIEKLIQKNMIVSNQGKIKRVA